MRAVVLASLLLCSCDEMEKKNAADMQLALRTGEQSAQLAELRNEVDALKQESAQLGARADATDARFKSVTDWVKKNEAIDDQRWESLQNRGQ